LEEAADAVAAYLPHRPRPKDPSGLLKNLRLRAGGRLYWHWDPQLMNGPFRPNPDDLRQRLDDAARALKVPTLLIRGGLSEVVSLASVKAFRDLARHAEFVDIAGADHMVAGDANDPFNAAVIDFIARHNETA
jgi:pimeloyl-ACP methyl ester carboxylesterase